MRLVYSKLRKRVHNIDGGRSDERCNIDAIRDEDRVTLDSSQGLGHETLVTGVAHGSLKLCKRCFPDQKIPA